MIDVRLNPLDERRVKQRLGAMQSKSGLVMARAVKRGRQAAATELKKQIAATYRLAGGSKEIKQAVDSKTGSPTANNPTAQLVVSGGNIPLSRFTKVNEGKITVNKARGRRAHGNAMKRIKQKLKGRVLKASPGAALTGDDKFSPAFVAKMKSGHVDLFERQYGVQMKHIPKGRKSAEKIVTLSSISVAAMAGKKKIAEQVMKTAGETIQKRLDHEIKRVLEGNG